MKTRICQGSPLSFLVTVCAAELLVLALGRQDRILHGIRVSSLSLCVRVQLNALEGHTTLLAKVGACSRQKIL